MSRGKSNTPWKLASVSQTGERRANADAGSRVGFVGAGGNCCGFWVWHDCMNFENVLSWKKRDGTSNFCFGGYGHSHV